MSLSIAIDAMGGDNAPQIIMEALAKICTKPGVSFKLFGLSEQVIPLFAQYGISTKSNIEFIPCAEVITGDTKTFDALKYLRDSSMRQAIESVSKGQADGVISAGNTGIFMALSKLILKTLPNIYRPAITTIWPTLNNKNVVMLDLGANIEVTAETLVQFCLMGQVFSKCVQQCENPKVGLLNIGSEDLKGTVVIQKAHALLKQSKIIKNYCGFIESDQIFFTDLDVIVTDGFSGNITLKTAEGTLRFFAKIMQQEITKNIISKLGALLLRPALQKCKNKLNPNNYNGAQFLGLQSVSVKSHGGTDANGFYAALNFTINLISNGINSKITKEINFLKSELA